jgi:hypothetical protein
LLRSALGLVAVGAALPAATAFGSEQREPSPPIVQPLFPTILGPSLPKASLFGADSAATVALPAWVRPRDAWGAAAPVQPYVTHTPTGVSLHHTGVTWNGDPPPEQYLRNVQAFHVGPVREWEDIAYHFLIDLDGRVWAGRPPTVRGNPSIYYDPSGLILICLLGDYEYQQPNEEQIATAARTAAWAIGQFKMRGDALSGHRDHAPTTCPGEQIYRLLRDGSFARRVREML